MECVIVVCLGLVIGASPFRNSGLVNLLINMTEG